jgi:hypothetical protein
MTVFSPLSSSNGSCQTWYFQTRPLHTPTRSWMRFSNPWCMRTIPFVSIIGNHDVESSFMSASNIHNYPRRTRPQVASPGEGVLIVRSLVMSWCVLRTKMATPCGMCVFWTTCTALRHVSVSHILCARALPASGLTPYARPGFPLGIGDTRCESRLVMATWLP